MNNTLKALLKKYGTEEIIARVIEQLRILATCEDEDEDVKKVVKELLASSSCDTEYIYTLCEFTNLVTYVSEEAVITDSLWNEEDSRDEILAE